MRSAVPNEPRALPSKPALEGSSVHSTSVLATTLTRNGREFTKQLAKTFNHAAQRLDYPCLNNRCDALSRRGFVRQVVKRIEDVGPSFVLSLALRDCSRELRNLGGDPPIIVPRVQDGEVDRI
jgi:hypothetical protein